MMISNNAAKLAIMSRLEYNNLNTCECLFGCDWSHWQADTLNNEILDYDFFIHKITEGKSFIDKRCKPRADIVLDAEKPLILYHFLNANYSGDVQALHFINTVKQYFPGRRVGLCIDFEIPENDANIKRYNDFINICLSYQFNNLITYCGDFSKVRAIAQSHNMPLWVARWRKRKPETACKLWQFTNTPYDLDLFFGGVSDLSLLQESIGC